MNDDLVIAVLRAAGHENAAELAAKVLERREPEPEPAPEPEPEPEPVATGPVPVAPSPLGRPNPEGEAAFALAALHRDVPRLAPQPAVPNTDRGEAA